jgi:hypothetical protein
MHLRNSRADENGDVLHGRQRRGRAQVAEARNVVAYTYSALELLQIKYVVGLVDKNKARDSEPDLASALVRAALRSELALAQLRVELLDAAAG